MKHDWSSIAKHLHRVVVRADLKRSDSVPALRYALHPKVSEPENRGVPVRWSSRAWVAFLFILSILGVTLGFLGLYLVVTVRDFGDILVWIYLLVLFPMAIFDLLCIVGYMRWKIRKLRAAR